MSTVNNITQILQDDIRILMQSFCWIYRECADIHEVYWNTDANTVLGAVANDTDPVTQATCLTKSEMINGITLIDSFSKFCNNQSVPTGDYLSYSHNIMYGTATPTQINSLIESLGNRLKEVCSALVTNYTTYLKVEKIYFENEISDLVGVIDNERVVFGSSMTKSDLVAAITMLNQFKNFMGNLTVTQGNYVSTIAKWNMY